MTDTPPLLLWFRDDLRLADNPAVAAAAASGRPVIPVHVRETVAGRPLGGAANWWRHHSLAALAADLAGRGSRLILRDGGVDALIALARETGADRVVVGRRPDPAGQADEGRLAAAGLAVEPHDGHLLCPPGHLTTGGGRPYRVFTPFWKALRRHYRPPAPLAAPARLTPPGDWPAGDRLDAWGLCPSAPDWAGGLRATWTPGAAAARDRLAAFIDTGLAFYADARDRPDRDITSRLSPHLRFGELSPHQVWRSVQTAADGDPALAPGAEAFLRELAWRDFAWHMLNQAPDLATRPLRPEFADFPWRRDDAALAAWQAGRTGYPLVDAGMRQLWQTGWMPNRVRMVAASFLVKDLLIPWQLGEAWFWDTLVDADPANNPAGWQWVAGCGIDAAPYFRVFNPESQGRKFDPDGAYVRTWLPERADADDPHAVGGLFNPPPIVDHGRARARALAAHAGLRRNDPA